MQDENGYHFAYDADYLSRPDARPVSLILPLRPAAYTSKVLFPFFDGLIPEGWLKTNTTAATNKSPKPFKNTLPPQAWTW